MRFFNTVGPRQTGQYGMVVPNFVQQALAGEPITVFGDGTQQRSFTLRQRRRGRADEAGRPNRRRSAQVFNIGNDARKSPFAAWPSA